MPRKILVVHAHPDAGHDHLGDALAENYAEAADTAGHEVRFQVLNRLDFPLLESAAAWRSPDIPPDIEAAQSDLQWCDHVAFFYPLWMGDMPALLKGFLEQVMRPDFAFTEPKGRMPAKLLTGRSARLVVTMGMPAFFYRSFYRAHSVKSFRRNMLKFAGIKPVRTSLVGMVEGSKRHRRRWLERMRRLGRAGR
ncbi:MAG: NAD(P)H-dependent oxidoreductase [Wenzhouxiangellaceae bacterium]|jgi:putative NADPH-quinone reductase|nr:NAD(P)H-dependent oxidoreductase [Wenzhouxiangellaceae bacterium]MBS3747502.1 NAD(P)H-dependent oxidoreductase [Wenzhouxiangellaceae bacterium]MBS3823619.1 NAD(P)H-dependent oxidoreductase [Wenzhouxiangellaceae bacterium]